MPCKQSRRNSADTILKGPFTNCLTEMNVLQKDYVGNVTVGLTCEISTLAGVSTSQAGIQINAVRSTYIMSAASTFL